MSQETGPWTRQQLEPATVFERPSAEALDRESQQLTVKIADVLEGHLIATVLSALCTCLGGGGELSNIGLEHQ